MDRCLLVIWLCISALFIITNATGPLEQRLYKKVEPDENGSMSQDDVEIYYLKQRIQTAQKGSIERLDAQKMLDERILHSRHVDQSLEAIVELLVGWNSVKAQKLFTLKPGRQWNWNCVKQMIKSYQASCGTLKNYGLKQYILVFENLCELGVQLDEMDQSSAQICANKVKLEWMKGPVGFYERPRRIRRGLLDS